MEFSRQEYCSRWPIPSPGDLPDPGTEPESPACQVDSLPLSHQGSQLCLCVCVFVCVCVCVCVSMCASQIVLSQSSPDGHLCCFHALAVVNSAAMNIMVPVSFQTRVFIFFLDPGMEVLNQMVILFIVF